MDSTFETLQGRMLNAVADLPDSRDYFYRASLQPVPDFLEPTPEHLTILDQGSEGSCTGFALAAVLNMLDNKRQLAVDAMPRGPVSARMLYEMAKKFDEWPGDDYAGSSCRGAIKGWHNMGVCTEEDWPYSENAPGALTLYRAKKAMRNKPGAYYRLHPRLADYHAAINETGAIYVSANIHRGWNQVDQASGAIPLNSESLGGHAFAIVGYDEAGFWIQNSWGKGWATGGLAHWRYEDWQLNVIDAWVVRFGVPVEGVRSLDASPHGSEDSAEFWRKRTRRSDIHGHFVHLDDGQFHDRGRYFSSMNDVHQIIENLSERQGIKHLVLYAHGGLNAPGASANRINAMKSVFLENGIYPLHFMYDTGLAEELKDVVLRKIRSSKQVQGISDSWDNFLQGILRAPGRALWREMKQGAASPFADGGAGTKLLAELIPALPTNVRIHVVGHSNGSVLVAHLLDCLRKMFPNKRVNTCALMAPACTVKDFNELYLPLLDTPHSEAGIDDMQVYNLTDELERDDNVGYVYRKSLLYLVSRAFEEKKGAPLLGMEIYSAQLPANNAEIIYSEGERGDEPATRSESHGGFDNDPATMNSILKRILGVSDVPEVHFTKNNLDY